jgi:hypothetical protein
MVDVVYVTAFCKFFWVERIQVENRVHCLLEAHHSWAENLETQAENRVHCFLKTHQAMVDVSAFCKFFGVERVKVENRVHCLLEAHNSRAENLETRVENRVHCFLKTRVHCFLEAQNQVHRVHCFHRRTEFR